MLVDSDASGTQSALFGSPGPTGMFPQIGRCGERDILEVHRNPARLSFRRFVGQKSGVQSRERWLLRGLRRRQAGEAVLFHEAGEEGEASAGGFEGAVYVDVDVGL